MALYSSFRANPAHGSTQISLTSAVCFICAVQSSATHWAVVNQHPCVFFVAFPVCNCCFKHVWRIHKNRYRVLFVKPCACQKPRIPCAIFAITHLHSPITCAHFLYFMHHDSLLCGHPTHRPSICCVVSTSYSSMPSYSSSIRHRPVEPKPPLSALPSVSTYSNSIGSPFFTRRNCNTLSPVRISPS